MIPIGDIDNIYFKNPVFCNIGACVGTLEMDICGSCQGIIRCEPWKLVDELFPGGGVCNPGQY